MKSLKRPPAKKSPSKKATPPAARKAAPVKPKTTKPAPAPPARTVAKKAPGKPPAKPAPDTVAVWEEDPDASLAPAHRPPATLSLGVLPLQLLGTAPKPGHYPPGSGEFCYWNAAEALRRAREVWRAHLPETLQWPTGGPLEVEVGGGDELNARYDRKTLVFHQGVVQGRPVHTAESPDIVAHEYGHAVLDALRPDLWDAALDEVAAFHESFADLTALLATLQTDTVRASVLRETGGYLYQNSRVSRFAAHFGKAIHAMNSGAAPPDCLRNAVNSFFYREPLHLSPLAPHSELSAEPHSFSRVFTAGFFEAMAGMLAVHASSPTPDDLLHVARDAASLLAKAVKSAALSAAFSSEVAAQLVWADGALFAGKYDEVLRSAFVRRGLLSLEAVRSLRAEASRAIASTKPGIAGDEMPRGRDMMMRATAYGLGEGALVVRTASFSRRGLIASAAPDAGSTPVPGVEQATQSFLETLFRRGRVDFSQCKPGLSTVPHLHVRRKTHYLVEQNGQYHLRRRCFDEGFEDLIA